MNWQLIQNVNCPLDELLLLVFNNDNNRRDCCFACRRCDGYMYFGDTPEEALSKTGEKILYESIRDSDSKENPCYWTLFVWP